MWISNTATTAMMVPIVEAVVQELFKVLSQLTAILIKWFIFFEFRVIWLQFPAPKTRQPIRPSASTIPKNNWLTTLKRTTKRKRSIQQTQRCNYLHSKIFENFRVNQSKDMKRFRRIRIGTLMSVAYASNIGGTGSLIGSSPQLAFKGIFEK